MELFKLLDLKLIVAQVVCFFLVLLVLKLFLWKPVFKILEDRRKKIEDELKAIEQAKVEAAQFRAEMEKALANIDATMQKRLREVEQAGEQKSREMKEKARQEAEHIIDDARDELRHEFARSREALKGEIVDMVMKVTEQMIQEKLTFDQDKKIIEQLLTELEKTQKAK
jgi:F-type H+-transporting ATPase subunit b